MESVFYYFKRSFTILLPFRSFEVPHFVSMIFFSISPMYIENPSDGVISFALNHQIGFKKLMTWMIIYYIYPYTHSIVPLSFLKFPVFCYYFLSIWRTSVPVDVIWVSQCHWAWVSGNTTHWSLSAIEWSAGIGWACWHSRCQQIRSTSADGCRAGRWIPTQVTTAAGVDQVHLYSK